MGSMIGRVYSAFVSPPSVTKRGDAIKFGILGAANIAPMALIDPAKSHPEVIIQAVAARDREKADKYAKANNIPEVKGSYQEMLDDPNIDAIYIPLPNAYHYEWAVRSIHAGKHVLLEKPSVSNSIEAETLFNLPELSQPNGPILLEAFHTRFFPSWQYFQSLVNPADVEHVHSKSMIPWWGTGKTDIFFNYNLSGGTIMSMGTYNLATLRLVFDAEPVECLSCETHSFPEAEFKKIDNDFKATFRFPNGGTGVAESTLRGPTIWTPSSVVVTNREVIVPDDSLSPETEKVLKRVLSIQGILFAILWHRIDIKDTFIIRTKGKESKVIRSWTETKSHKAYTFKEAGGKFGGLPGETFWISYRHMLEQFVNKVKGRGTQTWVTGEDSIGQMKMVDMAYEKSGLGIRPTSNFK
ncbi:putative oxidoreductase [Hyphodiscus hymeniophilus]|uniref:D-xylose 1-dehydrogenase (NADP(+), D-xylono-1,5-lactone-forming) n=1 Tax=Hyphodiscus hymeniophilus TaxID=353542 RepID=A0A9P6VEM0_9HELO|nr:putative oxidoreductase [Hyphodiscus hymeniophilus]